MREYGNPLIIFTGLPDGYLRRVTCIMPLRLTFYLSKDYKVAGLQALSLAGFALVVFRQHPETWMGG